TRRGRLAGVVLLAGSGPVIVASSLGADSFPILTALILVPAIGALVVALAAKSRPEFVRLIGIIFSSITGAMSVWLVASFATHSAGFQFTSQHQWIEAWGIGWHVGVDGISLFLVLLTGLIFPLSIIGVDPHHDEKSYLAWLLLLEAGVMGSFLSLDLF